MMTISEATRVVGSVVAAYPVPNWPVETIQLYVMELAQSRAEYQPSADTVREWYLTRDDRPTLHQMLNACASATRELSDRRERARPGEPALPPADAQKRISEIVRSIALPPAVEVAAMPADGPDEDLPPEERQAREQRRAALRQQVTEITKGDKHVA